MMYICAWQAPALPPARLTSSRITDASPSPSPAPPYSSGISAASQPAFGERVDELLRVGVARVDVAPVLVGVARAQLPHALAQLLRGDLRRAHAQPVRSVSGSGRAGMTSSASSRRVRRTSAWPIPGHCARHDQAVDAEALDVLADLCGARLGRADDEAPAAGQLVPLLAQGVALREDVALTPVDVRLVLGLQERASGGHRLLVGGGDADLLEDRQALDRLAPGLAARSVEHPDLALELRQVGVRGDHPRVAETRRALDGGVGVGGDPQRRRALGEQRQPGPLEPEALALGGHRLAGQQPLHGVELGLEELPPPAVDGEAGALDRPVAEPDAEDEAPVGDRVQGGGVLRHLQRVEQREQQDPGADRHAARLGGDPRQQRDGLVHEVRLGEEVLAGEHRLEAQLAGERHLLEVLAQGAGRDRRPAGAGRRGRARAAARSRHGVIQRGSPGPPGAHASPSAPAGTRRAGSSGEGF